MNRETWFVLVFLGFTILLFLVRGLRGNG